MANEFPVSGADILPNMFGSFNEAVKDRALNKQRQEQIDFQKTEFAQRKQDRDDAIKQNYLNSKSDYSKYLVPGAEQYDAWITGKLNDLITKYSSDASLTGLSPTEFQARFNAEAAPLIMGGSAVKNKILSELKTIQDFAANNKWVDTGKLKDAMYDKIAADYFMPDDGGGYKLKPLDGNDYQRNITSELIAADGSNYVSNDAVAKYIDDVSKMTTGRDEQYLLRDPSGGIGITKGRLSPFQTEQFPTDEYGFTKGKQKYGIVLEQGTTDQLPEASVNLLMRTPNDYYVFQKLFYDYAKQNNIDVSRMNDNEKRVAVAKFGYTFLKGIGIDNNQPSGSGYTKPPKITVNSGGGGSGSGGIGSTENITEFGDNVRDALSNGNLGELKDLFDERFLQGATANKYDGIELRNGQIVVKYHVDSDSGVRNEEEVIPNDKFITNRLVRLNKLIRGADAKVDKGNYKAKPTSNKEIPKELEGVFDDGKQDQKKSGIKFPYK